MQNAIIKDRKNYNFISKITNILLFLSICFMNIFGENTSMYQISKILTFFFMCFAGLYVITVYKSKWSILPVLLLIINLLWWYITTLWTPSVYYSSSRFSVMLQTIIFSFFIYIVFYKTKNYELYINSLYYSAFILILYTMSQYGFNNFLVLLQSGQRMGGIITNENTFGMIFSYAFLSGLYLYKFKKRLMYLIGNIPLIIFSLSSGSKKALFIIIIGMFLYWVFYYDFKKAYKSIIWITAFVLLASAVMHLPMFATVLERTKQFFSSDNKNASDLVRIILIKNGWNWFLERPLYGYGFEAYRVMNSIATGNDFYSHNNYIELLVNCGAIGFVLYYLIYVYVIISLKKQVRKQNSQILFVFILILLRLFMDFGMVSFTGKTIWILIAVALAMAANERIKYKDDCGSRG